jgi:chitin disaccharide deacetylase
MAMKKLLITSDDFGMCHAVNVGIVRAITEGVCASTNFMVPAPWFLEAVTLAKEHRLAVGVHLCLVSEWPSLAWGPVTANPRLKNANGHLPTNCEGLLESQATDADIYDELRAQILRVRALYGAPTHLDSHTISGREDGGIRTRILAVIKTLAKEFGLAYTYERDAGRLKHFTDEGANTKPDPEGQFAKLEQWTQPGRYHLIGHAAAASDELEAMCPPGHPLRAWGAELRTAELAFYIDPRTPRRIEQMGFERITVADLGQ